jgi:hypothetical protein
MGRVGASAGFGVQGLAAVRDERREGSVSPIWGSHGEAFPFGEILRYWELET